MKDCHRCRDITAVIPNNTIQLNKRKYSIAFKVWWTSSLIVILVLKFLIFGDMELRMTMLISIFHRSNAK